MKFESIFGVLIANLHVIFFNQKVPCKVSLINCKKDNLNVLFS